MLFPGRKIQAGTTSSVLDDVEVDAGVLEVANGGQEHVVQVG